MKNARILLTVLLLAGLVKVAFSQEAAEKVTAIAVKPVKVMAANVEEMTEKTSDVVSNAVNAVKEEMDVQGAVVNAIR